MRAKGKLNITKNKNVSLERKSARDECLGLTKKLHVREIY